MLLVVIGAPQASAAEVVTVVQGLELPAGIAFLGDGTMLVTERPGRLRLVEDGELLPEPLATFSTTLSGETGALGIAIPPDFDDDPAAYVFVTEPDGATNSIWRVPIDGGSPTRVIEGIPAATIHNGGGLGFGSDGDLYVSNGEQGDAGRAADPDVFGGKVYRYERDGTVPEGGPFPGSPVFAYGLRNPFGLAVDPLTGDIWVTDNGPSGSDEVNRIEAGGDYGWPEVMGSGCDDDCIDPVLTYESTIVPTGIAFAPEDHPSQAAGDLFFAAYGEGAIHQVSLDGSRTEATSDDVIARDDAIVAVAWGPQGLYYSTDDSVKVVRFASSGKTPEASPAPAEASPPDAGTPAPAADDGGSWSWPVVLVALLLLGTVTVMRQRLDRDTSRRF